MRSADAPSIETIAISGEDVVDKTVVENVLQYVKYLIPTLKQSWTPNPEGIVSVLKLYLKPKLSRMNLPQFHRHYTLS